MSGGGGGGRGVGGGPDGGGLDAGAHDGATEEGAGGGAETGEGDGGEGLRGRMGRHGRSGRMFQHGDLRLLVLALIAEAPRHGYELIREIEARLGGAYAPSPGVVYPTLTMLEELGLGELAEHEPLHLGRERDVVARPLHALLEPAAQLTA